jgi:hypothetical protein
MRQSPDRVGRNVRSACRTLLAERRLRNDLTNRHRVDEQAPTEGEPVSVFPTSAKFRWMDPRVSSLPLRAAPRLIRIKLPPPCQRCCADDHDAFASRPPSPPRPNPVRSAAPNTARTQDPVRRLLPVNQAAQTDGLQSSRNSCLVRDPDPLPDQRHAPRARNGCFPLRVSAQPVRRSFPSQQ